MSASPSSSGADRDTDAVFPASYEDLRKHNVPSDFTIKVGEKSFPVHRETIAKHSGHFQEMLEQGFDEAPGLSIVGVRQCVEFMYTGLFDVDAETVEDILKTADTWQLSEVKSTCSEFLKEELDFGNCVTILNIATKYCDTELHEAAQQVYNQKFRKNLSDLLELTKDNFVDYLVTHALAIDVAWDGIVNWIKHDSEKRSEFIHELVGLMDWDRDISAKLLKRMGNELSFRNSSPCKEFLFEKIFLDWEVFDSCLDVESYFILKELSNEFKYVLKQIKDSLSDFFKQQIVLLSQKPEFRDLKWKEILTLFSRQKSDVFAPEKWWWNTAVMWVNHDPVRKKYFPKLLKFLNFHEFPSFFISVVVNEPLVMESQECCKVVMDCLAQQEQKKDEFVAVLYSDGRIKSLNVKSWEDLPKLPEPVENAEIFHFLGKLCVINGSKLFYLHNNKWIGRRSGYPEMTGQKKIATLDNFIYVACGGKLFCYDSISDHWNKVALSNNNESVGCLAALGSSLFASFREGIHKLENKHWTHKCGSQRRSFAFSVTLNQNIFFCREDGEAGKFDLDSNYTEIISVPDPNQNLSGSSRNAELAIESGATCASQSIVQATFGLAGRLSIVRGNKVCIWDDDLCNNWTYFVDVPRLATGTVENVVEINIVSACSFY